jgi:hypothetical protein
LLVCSFDRTIKRGSYISSLTMHSKAIKICNLAQRVHGSKVEARIDGNSIVLNWTS